MSYTMTHIYIAENVAQHIRGITDFPTYIVGSIAPDAVHARDDYTPAYKEKSHLFTEGLRWGRIENMSQVNAWEQSIADYYNSHKGSLDFNFLLGYMVHLYSDVYSSMNFYAPIVLSAGGDAEKIKPQFLKENFGYNYYLYLKYSRDKDLRDLLEAGKAVTLDGIIEKEDIERRIQLLFEQEFSERDISDIEYYTMCSHEAMKKLIDGSTELVLNRLKQIDSVLIKRS